MRTVVPEICVERARLVTESYRQTEGEPYIIRRAKSLQYLLEHMTVFIDDEELIAGNHASRPRCAPVFPEFGLFDKKELDLMPIRKVDTLQISDEDKAYLLNDIFPYWKSRATGERAAHYFSPGLLEILDSPYAKRPRALSAQCPKGHSKGLCGNRAGDQRASVTPGFLRPGLCGENAVLSGGSYLYRRSKKLSEPLCKACRGYG